MSAPIPAAAPSVDVEFKPFVPDERRIPEFTVMPLIVGAILGIIFGASSLYLVLKVGMTVSASIPIAVLSITLFRFFGKLFGGGATILENNITQCTGSAGESIAFGVGVTMPALFILGYDIELARVMLVATLGGLLGVLMMIPLRRAFIVKQHGKLPYPEGTACAEVLIVGEQGGSSATTVFAGFGLAFVYQSLMQAFKFWKDVPEWPLWRTINDKIVGFRGASVSCEISPALLGVGYIIGTRISCIMVAGGVLASWVLIPAIMFFGGSAHEALYPAAKPIREMGLDDIWHDYILYIGAGAVAAGGIISMIQALPMIVATASSGLRDVVGNRSIGPANNGIAPRTERDLPLKFVILGCLAIIVAITLAPMLKMNIVGAVLIVLFGFLFVTVSSRLTGEIGSSSNPISGMTVATLLMTCTIFLMLGWTDSDHRVAALSVAAIVCIAASNGGTTSQDLKTGYLVGGTPKYQQLAILVGALSSALVIGATLLVLNGAATIYSKKDLPTAIVDVRQLPRLAQAGGTYSADHTSYHVLHARAGDVEGVPEGRYLVDDVGHIQYHVDPGINGKLKKDDDGRDVEKYNAPKAALMAFIIDGILAQRMPWELVLLGVAIALVLELSGVPSLPFAVGVYLPLSSSTPIFVGGLVRWFVDRMSRRRAAEGDTSPGVLFSSGLIAGGSIAGILVAVSSYATPGWATIGEKTLGSWATGDGAALVPFGVLVLALLVIGCRRPAATGH